MKYDFDKTMDIKDINSVKWSGMKEKGIIPMWIADMDFETVPEISKALKKRTKKGIYGYTLTPESYYGALIDWFEKRHDWSIERKWITHTSGVINALHIALKSAAKKNDGVLIQPPVYHPFYRVIERCGMRITLNPLKLINGKYALDTESLEEQLKNENPKVMILCNPHNPTGKVFTKEELVQIGDLCLKYGVTVISDEIHGDLIYEGHKHIAFASISEEFRKNSIICTAPSKTFNLAGLFTSNIIIPDEVKKRKFISTAEEIGLHPENIFGIIACEAGYRYGAKWLEELLSYLEENKNFAIGYIKEKIPKISFVEPEGTYFFWIDFRNLGLKDGELEKFLLDKAKILLNQGCIFGSREGSGFARMNIACPRMVLREALERLKNAISKALT